MSETKPVEWAILIVTVFHPFVSYLLETRRDKRIAELKSNLKKQLEAKEKRIKNLEEKQQNHEKEKFLELKELVRKFKKMHTNNSKSVIPSLRNRLNNEGWLEWNLNLKGGEEEEEYEEIFFGQMKEIINRLRIADKECSFVGIIEIKSSTYRLSDDLETDIEFLNWKKYREIFSKSTNSFNYFDNLIFLD